MSGKHPCMGLLYSGAVPVLTQRGRMGSEPIFFSDRNLAGRNYTSSVFFGFSPCTVSEEKGQPSG